MLIGTKAVGTGVDGLQHVARRLIFATLPWTHADFEQVVGRLYRQGRQLGDVEVIVPIAQIHQEWDGQPQTWSSCAVKWRRVLNKGTLSAAAVDGVEPSKGELVSAEVVSANIQAWLRRLSGDGAVLIEGRRPLEAGRPAASDRGGRRRSGVHHPQPSRTRRRVVESVAAAS